MDKKIAVYKRYSTESQDMKTQDKEISDYLTYKNENTNDLLFYPDEAVSGASDNRPEFQRLINDIKQDKISKVIALKLDRIGRSSRDLQNFLYLLKSKEISLILIKDNVDTSTANGKLFFDLLAAFAEWERTVIIDRMRDGKRRAKSEGKLCHRHKKVIDVNKIRKLHDENKLSFNTIKKMFDSEGKKYSVATIIKRYRENNT